jgi:hypothetical protein
MNEKFMVDNFKIRFTDHPNKEFSVKLSELQRKTRLIEFIDFYGPKIKALSNDVVATYFCSAFGWVLSGIQYLMSQDQSMDMALSNIELQLVYNPQYDYYEAHFKLLDSSSYSRTSSSREDWRKEQLSIVYGDSITPLLEVLSNETGVKIRELWGQLAIGLYSGYDKNLSISQNEEQKRTIELDFTYLTKELEPAFFNATKNPFDINIPLVENPYVKDQLIRLKPTCCLYYLTEGADTKCYTCPRMSEKERELLKQEIRQEQMN